MVTPTTKSTEVHSVARFIKRGIGEHESRAADQKVKETVEKILGDIRTRGEAAVRELSLQLDQWSPENFRLSQAEIEDILASLPGQTVEDIKFAQAQVQRFAQEQRKALNDVEVETLPGVTLGHKNIPVNSVGCYVPGGRYPMVASAHMSIVTAKVAGVKRIIGCTPPNERRAAGRNDCGNGAGRGGRDLRSGGRAGASRDGIWHPGNRAGRYADWTWKCLRGRG